MKKNNLSANWYTALVFLYGMGNMAAVNNTLTACKEDNIGVAIAWGVTTLYFLGLGIRCAHLLRKVSNRKNKALKRKDEVISKKCAEIKALQKQLENLKLNNQQKVQ